MKGPIPVILLAALLLALIGLQWVILPDPSRRNYEFLPGMVESAALDAQSPPVSLPDGTVLDLRSPPGAVARGYLPLGLEATPENALLAGRRLTDPLPAEDADAGERGAFVFATFCSVCHGVSGAGDGPVTRRGVPPPPSLLLPHAVDMPDGQMFHVITMGQGNMAAYAAQVEREDRWRVIRYIRTLQASAVDVAQATPPPATEEPQ
jgi:mono/diheme cytochrome c family protein